MSIIVPTQDEKPDKSLAKLIDSQYTQYDSRNVIGHTEIPKKAIPAMVMLMTLQETLGVLTAEKPTKEKYGYNSSSPDEPWLQDEYVKALLAWKMRNLVEEDDVAMLNLISEKYIFSYGLAMRSIDRKIRMEGVRLGAANVIKEAEEHIGMPNRVMQALGLGRVTKYDKVYVRKGDS